MSNSSLGFEGQPSVLITLAGWEDRFHLGIVRDLAAAKFETVLQFYFQEKSDWTSGNREKVSVICGERGIYLRQFELVYDRPIENWKSILNVIGDICTDRRVVVDISTMPRDIIWNIFDALLKFQATGQFIYWRPGSYSDEWLSRDPGRPRLALGHGGISMMDRGTLLAVSMGYDVTRVIQIANYFEPQQIILFFQEGVDPATMKERVEIVRKNCGVNIGESVIDFMTDGVGLYKISQALYGFRDDFNIMLASLGPKTSAVSFYNMVRENNQMALVYTPSFDFNRAYSHGIGDFVIGALVS